MRKDTRNSGFAGGTESSAESRMKCGAKGGDYACSNAQAEFRWWAGVAGLFSYGHTRRATHVHTRGDNEFYDVALRRGVSL